MAFFGLFGDDEPEQQGTKRSFWGSVGDFFMTALKWVAGIALLITGVTAAVHYFPALKNWLNEKSGENKVGDKADGLFNGIIDNVTDLPNKISRWLKGETYQKVSSSSISEEIEVNGQKALKAKTDEFKPSVGAKDVEQIQSQLAEINNPTITSEERSKTYQNINDKLLALSSQAARIDAWNNAANDFNNRNPNSPVRASIIAMNIPSLPERLADFGKIAAGENKWSAMSDFQRISFVNDALKERTKNQPDLDTLTLGGSVLASRINNPTNGFIPLGYARLVRWVGDKTGAIDADSPAGEEIRKQRIHDFFAEGNINQVTELATDAENSLREKIATMSRSDKDYNDYVKAADSFAKIKDYGLARQMQTQLSTVRTGAFAEVARASESGYAQLTEYNNSLVNPNKPVSVTQRKTEQTRDFATILQRAPEVATSTPAAGFENVSLGNVGSQNVPKGSIAGNSAGKTNGLLVN